MTVLISFSLSLELNAQEVIRDSIPYFTIEEINSSNDTLINPTEYPEWPKYKSNVIKLTRTRKIDTTWYNDQIMNAVKDWKVQNKIVDDGRLGESYALIKNVYNHYEIKKVIYEVSYLASEGRNIDRYLTVIDENIVEILCLFTDDIVLDEKPLDLHVILHEGEPEPYWGLFSVEHPIKRNTLFSFNHLGSQYKLAYTASLCSKRFQYRGHGSIIPIYYNNQLIFRDLTNNSEQIILKVPFSAQQSLTEILYGDIDNDGELDIIYTLCDETCKRRMVFLSSKRDDEPLLKYMGHVEVYCYDP